MEIFRKLSAVLFLICLAFICAVVGCKAYKHGGTIITIGDQTILPEITEPESGLAFRIYESIAGARIWTRENSKTSIVYTNQCESSYFGMVDSKSYSALSVAVVPVAPENTTNILQTAAESSAR